MIPDAGAATRCAIDTVELERIDRLLRETPASDLARIFAEGELSEAGEGPSRTAHLAARFAAKEACMKLFPRETALGRLDPVDFSIANDSYGAPQVVFSARGKETLDRHRIDSIAVSLTHSKTSASAIALARPSMLRAPMAGRLVYHLLPLRRAVVLENLRRVYGASLREEEIVELAQAHYAHLWRLLGEFVRFRFMSQEARAATVSVENVEAFVAAQAQGKGVLVLTGHFGNWEVSTVAGLANFPQVRGQFHFVRRPIKPRWLDRFVTRRFVKAGFGVIAKRGSLDAILDRLGRGDAIVFPFDQHANPGDGIAVDFFGTPAGTFRSLAILALATGAPVLPAASWREASGRHVLRFEEPLAVIECDDTNEAIRRNTRAYNTVLERLILRRPDQWYWIHRRWKSVSRKEARRGRPAQRRGSAHG